MEVQPPVATVLEKQEEPEKTVDKTEVIVGPEENVIKHPLQHTWTLWYFDHGRSKVWEENQIEIISFDTIEDFWSLFNHIKMASELRTGCDYSLFKQGITPMWEDNGNRQGGRWLISMDRKQRTSEVDKYWLEIVLLMIGEVFDSDDICGAVINIRAKGDKLGLWTANAQSPAVIPIGRKLKERLQIPPNVRIEYQVHKDTAAKSGSVAKSLYVL